jgi:tRNA(Ser,Leu) C12 N-acetylase TAN1
MTRHEIETSVFNYLDGQDVGNVELDLEDFMMNVIEGADEGEWDLDEIADEAREILTEIKARQEAGR